MLPWLRDKWKQDLVTLRKRREKERRDRKILCPRCGYDVKILPDRPCPECGLFIDSAWRLGKWGAGSPRRRSLPLALGFLGWGPFPRCAVLLFAGISIAQLGPGPLPTQTRNSLWAVGAAVGACLLTGASTLTIAIVRRRWLAYGPLRYTIRLSVSLVVLLAGSMIVLGLTLNAFQRQIDEQARLYGAP